VGNAAYGALYLNGSAGITPSTTNYTVAHDTTDGLLNLNVSGSNGTISLLVNAVTEMSITNSSVTIKQPITFRTNVFNDATATPVTTTDGTLTTIYTDSAIPASTMYDYVVTVVGLDSTDGYGYRADFSFSYQRIASAAPTVVGASPVPLNVRASTGAVSWGGGSIALSTNSVIVQVQGIASRTIDWNCSVNRIKVA
jgi:hypothetical protein